MRTIGKRLAVGLALAAAAGGAAVAVSPPTVPPAESKPAPEIPAAVEPGQFTASVCSGNGCNGSLPSDLPKVDTAAAVALDWSGPPAVKTNAPAEYTLTARNVSARPVQKVTVQVKVPAPAAVTAVAPAAREVDGVYVWDVGTLDAGQAVPLKLTVSSPVRGDLGVQAWVTCTGTAAMTVAVKEPKLEVTLTAPERVTVGDRIAVKFRVANVGNAAAEAVSYELRSADGGNPFADTAGPAPLAAGADLTGTVHVPIAVEAEPGTRGFRLTAVTADGLRAEAEVRVRVSAPKLTAEVIGPDRLLVGQQAGYVVRVTNVGDAAAERVRAWAAGGDVPAEVALPDLAPGASADMPYTLKAARLGEVALDARATADRAVVSTAGRRVTVAGVPALRMEVVDVVDPVQKGEETVYEVRVTNTGTAADENVTVVCPLPAPLRLLAATGPTAARAEDLNTVTVVRFDPVRELAPKTEAVFRVKVKAVATGDVRFAAQLTSRHLTTSVTKEESTRVYGD